MERPLQIIPFITSFVLTFGLSSTQERWILSAEEMESTKINGHDYPKQISTYKNKHLIGDYLRERRSKI